MFDHNNQAGSALFHERLSFCELKRTEFLDGHGRRSGYGYIVSLLLTLKILV